jgi:8-oxo-dGTP pyrophosphatase MutT (NUDIX family)
MTYKPLVEYIRIYQNTWASGEVPYEGMDLAAESDNARTIEKFATYVRDCFSRNNRDGHITGSALVTDPSLSRVLLTHHRRLNKWLQLGGHSDGHNLTWEVAMREAEEESGISGLHFFVTPPDSKFVPALNGTTPPIFDMDYHEIPARGDEKSHVHYDVRYLIVAPYNARPVVSDESHDVRWFDLEDARSFTRELSMHRQFNKLEAIKLLHTAVPSLTLSDR